MSAKVNFVLTVVAERQVRAELGVLAILRAKGAFERRAELFGWRPRKDADRAADRVATEQSALRASQDLDAVEVDELLGQQACVLICQTPST